MLITTKEEHQNKWCWALYRIENRNENVKIRAPLMESEPTIFGQPNPQ
jgi:hypothetical protein